MPDKLSLFLCTLFFCSLLINCEQQGRQLKTYPGLIGAYYGNDDFTRIKDAEVLTRLEQDWDEETGHGASWSAEWEGYLKIPESDEIFIRLVSDKPTQLEIGGQLTLNVNSDNPESEGKIDQPDLKPFYIKIRYSHAGGGQGGFKLTWWRKENAETVIPREWLYFTETQANEWNWIPEPDPRNIDYSSFKKVQTQHIIVYDQPGFFAGWPANNGIWSWGDEILVGFTLAYYQEKELHHSVDETRPSRTVLARSPDGGRTWSMEDPDNFIGDGGKIRELVKPIQFDHPDFIMRSNRDKFYISYDRGRNWQGPFEYPSFDRDKLTSRTDYIVNGPDDCFVFLSTEEEKVQARLQDRAFCAQTTDGGLTFAFLSWIGEAENVRAVMPSSLKIADKHLVSALRRRFDEKFETKPRLPKNWIDVYESKDAGQTWQFLSKVADTDMGKHNGNPPSLVLLSDGRLVVTYGYRAVPYGIRAKISRDNGKTWGDEIHLRDDGRTFDIGYTRSVQRLDGNIVTVYYYTTEVNPEQHIAATIWEPDKIL